MLTHLFAARLLPNSCLFDCLPIREPNWMALFTRAAASGSPILCKALRSNFLSPTPAQSQGTGCIMKNHSMQLKLRGRQCVHPILTGITWLQAQVCNTVQWEI